MGSHSLLNNGNIHRTKKEKTKVFIFLCLCDFVSFQTGKPKEEYVREVYLVQIKNQTLNPGRITQLVRESSQYSNVFDSIPSQGTYKN